MNPLQIFNATLSCVLFAGIAIYGGAGLAHEMSVGGVVEELQQWSVVGAAGLAGFLAQFLPLIKNLLPTSKDGKGNWLTWFFGLSSGNVGFVAQIIGLIEAALTDTDHKPCYFEGKIYWDHGAMTPLVIGTPPGSKPTPAPTPVPAPQPAPSPAPAVKP